MIKISTIEPYINMLVKTDIYVIKYYKQLTYN